MVFPPSLSNEEFGVADSLVAMELYAFFDILLLAHHIDQDYKVDGFAQVVHPQVLFAYYFLEQVLHKVKF